MPNQQLFDFIKNEVAKNTPRDQIKSMLIQNGWTPSDVEAAFISLELPRSGPQNPAQQVTTTVAEGPNVATPNLATSPAKSYKGLVIAIIGLICVVFIGVGVYAYFWNESHKSKFANFENPNSLPPVSVTTENPVPNDSQPIVQPSAKIEAKLPDISGALSQLDEAVSQFTSLKSTFVDTQAKTNSSVAGLKQQLDQIKTLGADQTTISKFNNLYSAMVAYRDAANGIIDFLTQNLSTFANYKSSVSNRTMTAEESNAKIIAIYAELNNKKDDINSKIDAMASMASDIKKSN